MATTSCSKSMNPFAANAALRSFSLCLCLVFCFTASRNGYGAGRTDLPPGKEKYASSESAMTGLADLQKRPDALPMPEAGGPVIDSCGTVCPAADTTDTAESLDDVKAGEDSLYDKAVSDMETFMWDSAKINFKKLDSVNWTDTVRIVLADSLKNKRFVQPFCGPITSNFGMRSWRWHYGTDIRLLTGDTVRAAFNGIVRLVAYDRHGYGHVIVLRHADGLETLYGHLSKKIVVQGQHVKAGDVIGLGGNTGHSTGSHLHFEMRYYGEAFDPTYIVDFDGFRLRQDTLVLTKANFEYLIELRKERWHTVCRGNTLGSIARCHHTSIGNLCALNHVTRGTILSIGRKIRYQ